MSSKTSKCLASAGITQVVWVDDFFASPSRDELAEAASRHIANLKEQGRTDISLPAPFNTVDLTRPKNELEEKCIEVMQDLGDEQLAEAVRQLASLSGTTATPTAAQPDLSSEEFKELQAALGDGLQTFSYGKWTSGGVSRFESAKDDTLFLIDREFGREGILIDGADLLRDLVSRTQGFGILLTHTCTEPEQEQRRIDLAAEKKFEPHRFCILSKRQTDGESIDLRFARAIRSVMTHRFNGEAAHIISDVTGTSAKDTAAKLTSQSVSDLERALFENPREEGVLEYDTLLRVFQVQRRHALSMALGGERIQKLILKSRNFIRATHEFRSTKAGAEMSLFREWREREVFENGSGLNALHAPLACGDVFECEKKTRCILLAQPCDLMIRSDGKRRAHAGLLAIVSEETAADTKPAGARYFEIKGVFKSGKQWRIDFQNTIAVDLSVLDLAVFNSNGSVELRRGHPEPSIILTDGWTRRMKRAKTHFFPTGGQPHVPPIAIGPRASTLEGRLDGDLIRYPLRRIGRVEDATATAIFAAWATFQTRAALDYDFAQLDGASSEGPAAQVAVVHPTAVKVEPETDVDIKRRMAGKPALEVTSDGGDLIAGEADAPKPPNATPEGTNVGPRSTDGADEQP